MNKRPEQTQRTKADLQEAFWRLYSTHSIEDITIGQITTLAGYNRGTFYLYYHDIYDLLEQIEADLLVQMGACIEDCFENLGTAGPLEVMEHVLGFYEGNRSRIVVLLGEKGDASFVRLLKDLMKSVPIWNVSDQEGLGSGEQDLLLEYTVTGVLYMVAAWLEDPHGVTAEQLLHLIYDSAIRKR